MSWLRFLVKRWYFLTILCSLLAVGSVIITRQWIQLVQHKPSMYSVSSSQIFPSRWQNANEQEPEPEPEPEVTTMTLYSASTRENTFSLLMTSSPTETATGDEPDAFDVGEDKPEAESDIRETLSTTSTISTLQVSTSPANSSSTITTPRHVDIQQQVRVLRQPSQPRVVRGKWQLVEGSHEIYIMSAFYDQREETEGGHVRVIGMADREVTEVHCLLWFHNITAPEVVLAKLIPIGPVIAPFSKTVYEQLIFSCRVRNTNVPVNVSLIILQEHFQPSTLLPVQIPAKPSSPSEVIEFGHCMSIMYKNQDPYRLIEWLELHRMWGVGEMNIYTTAVDNITGRILEHYVKSGFVRHERIPSAVDETDTNEPAVLLNMSPVINDCLYRNLYRYKYIVCTDIDEMIVPATTRNYSDMLKDMTSGIVVHSFLFRNAYFFLDFGATSSEPWYLLSQRYMKRVKPSRFGYSSKSITRTLSCVGLQNHLCWQRLPVFQHHANWNVDVPLSVGKNHHYKKCHFDEYHSKNGICLKMMMKDSSVDKTMSQFRDVLSDRVIDKLIELDLAEPTTDDSWKLSNPVP